MNMDAAAIPPALLGTQLMRCGLLSPEDKQALAAIAGAPQMLRANVDCVSEGSRTDSLYLLIDGWAGRYKITREGARQIVGLAVPGDVCNLDSFMLPVVNFGVRTLTPATVIGLPRDPLQALAAERLGVAHAIAWLTIRENAILSEWALSLGRQSAREQVTRLLSEVAVRIGSQYGTSVTFALPVTQEQIADMLGMTSVHVNRTMQQLRKEGLIVVEDRHVTVPNITELRRQGGFDGAYLRTVPSTSVGKPNADQLIAC